MVYVILTMVDFNSGKHFLLTMLKFKWLLVFCSFTLSGSLMFEQRIVENN